VAHAGASYLGKQAHYTLYSAYPRSSAYCSGSMAVSKAAAGLGLLLLPWAVHAACPYMSVDRAAPGHLLHVPLNAAETAAYAAAVDGLDLEAVKSDIKQLLSSSQPQWPADELDGRTYYGGLFVRLAWHCSGSYRCVSVWTAPGGGRWVTIIVWQAASLRWISSGIRI
jgi:hypothetical protein